MTLTRSPSRRRRTAERAAAKALASRLPFIEQERVAVGARRQDAVAEAALHGEGLAGLEVRAVGQLVVRRVVAANRGGRGRLGSTPVALRGSGIDGGPDEGTGGGHGGRAGGDECAEFHGVRTCNGRPGSAIWAARPIITNTESHGISTSPAGERRTARPGSSRTTSLWKQIRRVPAAARRRISAMLRDLPRRKSAPR